MNRIFFKILPVIFTLTSWAGAHSIGENYIFMSISKEGVATGQFEFHIDDLRKKLDIDIQGESATANLALIKETSPQVHQYILENFEMGGDGEPVSLKFTKVSILDEYDSYAQYHFQATFAELPDVLSFRHNMMYEDDRQHRGLFLLNYNPVTDTTYPGEHVALIFNQSDGEYLLDLREPIPDLLRPRDFIWQGVLHIWIGIDHILFLVVLILPSVLLRKKNEWEPSPHFLKSSLRIVKIVTIFTIAHSITLGLTALGYISLSSRFVESMIAASIVLVALNNIFPRFKESTFLIIFAFGLFHGMGFASVMADIPFRMENLVKVLVAFNVGVELGQVAIVLVAFVVLFALRKRAFYVPLILRGGSILAGLVAVFWFVERAFSL